MRFLTNLRALLLSALRNTTLSACAIKIPTPSRKKSSRTRKISFINRKFETTEEKSHRLLETFHQQTENFETTQERV